MSSTLGVVGEELDRKAKQILAEKGKTFDEVTPDEYERAIALAEREHVSYDVDARMRAHGLVAAAAAAPDTVPPYPVTDTPSAPLNPPRPIADYGLHLDAMEILRRAGVAGYVDQESYEAAVEQARRDRQRRR
jgi:hypothetical protein